MLTMMMLSRIHNLSAPDNMGGCQNYGPLLGPCYNTAPII